MDDREIVALFWARDEKAIGKTAEKYGKYCFSIAKNILYDTEDATECVNDAYMSAWNSMPPHRPENLAAFLGKLTRYVSLKRRRGTMAQKRGGGSTDAALSELGEVARAGENIDDSLNAKELSKAIDLFLDTVPKSERMVFVCRYWYFDTVSEISERFGYSEGKVKTMLFRTRKKLRKKLIEEGLIIER